VKYSPPVQWDTFNLPLDNVIGSQFIDSQGNKWFSNFSSSVCRLSHDDVTWDYFTDENYFNFIVSFCEDYEGNIYFGSAQRGVSVRRTTGSLLKVSGLPSEEAFDLALDRNGDILVGTTDGVAVVRDFVTVDHYTRANSGLLGDNIMDILVDWQGNKWFLIENQGVSVLRNTGEWDSLTSSDGLASSLIIDDLDGLAYDTEKGYLWIATKDGISRYETGDTPSPPDIVNVGVYPNPFIPRIHQGVSFNRIPDNASLYIFSLSLRKVRTIDYIDERTHTAFWNGTDEDGELVESGIYLFVVEDPNGNSATGKIAVIR
jgi:ligand-binding sensor domain-containing protein